MASDSQGETDPWHSGQFFPFVKFHPKWNMDPPREINPFAALV